MIETLAVLVFVGLLTAVLLIGNGIYVYFETRHQAKTKVTFATVSRFYRSLWGWFSRERQFPNKFDEFNDLLIGQAFRLIVVVFLSFIVVPFLAVYDLFQNASEKERQRLLAEDARRIQAEWVADTPRREAAELERQRETLKNMIFQRRAWVKLATEQAKERFEREREVAASFSDPDEAEAYLAGAHLRLRQRLVEIGDQA